MKIFFGLKQVLFLAALSLAFAKNTSALAQMHTDDLPAIKMGGSSTVAPFVRRLASQLSGRIALSVVQSGTTSGLQTLCNQSAGVIDLAGASRPITPSEIENCAAHNVSTLIEMKLGRDAIIFAQSQRRQSMNLTARNIYLALAAKIPTSDMNCRMQVNTHRQWRDVSAELPRRDIFVIGPALTSGTRDLFREMVLIPGAMTFPCLADLAEGSPQLFDELIQLRRDGAWVDGGENDHAIAHSLLHLDDALGIFGFSHLQDARGIEAIAFDGVSPTVETISSAAYPLARPLFVYAKADPDGEPAALVKEVLKAFLAPDTMAAFARLGLVRSASQERVTHIHTSDGTREVSPDARLLTGAQVSAPSPDGHRISTSLVGD